jgi:hypothetical protein
VPGPCRLASLMPEFQHTSIDAVLLTQIPALPCLSGPAVTTAPQARAPSATAPAPAPSASTPTTCRSPEDARPRSRHDECSAWSRDEWLHVVFNGTRPAECRSRSNGGFAATGDNCGAKLTPGRETAAEIYVWNEKVKSLQMMVDTG